MSPSDTPTTSAVPSQPTHRSGRRWWLILPLLGLVFLILGVGLIPAWLNTESGRNFLLSQASKALAPAKLEVDQFSWSWFQPTLMKGLRLKDDRGEVVLSAPEATWSRNLRQAILEPLNLGTLELPGAALTMDQYADGDIDLVEALKPVLGRDPRTIVSVHITRGTLRLKSPRLLEPVIAENLEVELEKPPEQKPIRFQVELTGPARGAVHPTLKIAGKTDVPPQGTKIEEFDGNLEVSLDGNSWPVGLAASDATPQVRLNYSGDLAAHRTGGRLDSEGKATLTEVQMEKGPLKGTDRLKLEDPLDLAWKVNQTQEGWDLSKVQVQGKELSLSGQGSVPSGDSRPMAFEGRVDLATFATQLRQTLKLDEQTQLERGTLQYGLTNTQSADAKGVTWKVTGEMTDLSARRGETKLELSEPVRLHGQLSQRPTDWSLDEFGMTLKGVQATGSGNLDDGVSVQGTIDLSALDPAIGSLAGLNGNELAGTGPFSLKYRCEPGKPVYLATLKTQLEARVPRLIPQEDRLTRPGDNKAGVPAPPAPGIPAPPAPGIPANPAVAPLNQELENRTFLVDATLNGPTNPGGWPTGWSGGQGTLDINQGDLKAKGNFAITGSGGAPENVTANLNSTLPWNGKLLGLDLAVAAHLQNDSWPIETAKLKLGLVGGPETGGTSQPLIDLACKGIYSPTAGTLQLSPIAKNSAADALLALATDGVNIRGLGTKNLQAKVALEGNAAAIDSLLATPGTEPPARTLAGRWTGQIEARPRPGEAGWLLGLRGQSQDLSVVGADGKTQTLGPLALDTQVCADSKAEKIEISNLSVDSRFARLEAQGQLNKPTSERNINVDGQVALKWAEVNALLIDSLGPTTRIAGRSRPFFIRGSLPGSSGEAKTPLTAEVGLDLETLQAQGLELGPTPLVVQISEGQVRVAPIDTTLNRGRIVLKPQLDQEAGGRWVLTMAPGSGIENAEVNQAMTHNVLAFVAPPLDNASRISGQVSAAFDRLSIPLGEGLADDAVVDGEILFHNVVFAPGPLAMQLYRALNVPPANIRLDQPVSLAIHDGMVEQRGFSFPLGDAGRVTLDGNVAFDRSIDIIGTIGLSGEKFATVPVFNQIAPALRLEVPIGGTLQDPKLDGKAMAQGMGRMGLNVAAGAGLGGLGALFDLINKPPPSPEEAARQQAEREAKRQQQRLRQQQQQEQRQFNRAQRRQMRGFP